MIELYSGTPGSGKSLHTAQKIKQWINVFRSPVIANFPINTDLLRHPKFGTFTCIDNSELCPEVLIAFSEAYRREKEISHVPEETILCVIDECQLIFNNREWAKPGRAAWMSFFTQHRKLGYRIILVAQFKDMLDKQIRSLIEYEYVHRKIKNVGFSGALINLIMGGGGHICIKLFSPMRSMQVGREFFKYDRTLADLYNTYNTFNADQMSPSGADSGEAGGTRLPLLADVPPASPGQSPGNPT